MGLAKVLGAGLAWWWGWGAGAALIFGLSLSCASTVVLLKALGIPYVVAEQNRERVEDLCKEGFGTVFYGEEELAKGMMGHVLRRMRRD